MFSVRQHLLFFERLSSRSNNDINNKNVVKVFNNKLESENKCFGNLNMINNKEKESGILLVGDQDLKDHNDNINYKINEDGNPGERYVNNIISIVNNEDEVKNKIGRSLLKISDEEINGNKFYGDSLIVEIINAKLERVLGSTSCPASIAIDQVSGTIAYPAGSTVILYNPRTGAEAHLIGATKNNISALHFSNSGRFIATGECGHDPKIRIWEVVNTEGKFIGKEVVELKHHIMGIGAVKFSNDDELLISVGNQHDKAIAVWNWRQEEVIAKNNLTSHICAIDVSQNGEYFVTVGVRHVKFWNLSKPDEMKGILQGRSAILSDKRNNTFTDVVCASNNRCFALTSTRQLIEFQDKKLVNSYESEEMVPYSLTISNNWLFMGCDNGDIEVYDIDTFEKVTRLPKPHWLGCDPQIIKDITFFNTKSHPSGSRYPNVHSMVFWKKSNYLTVFYSDRSFYTWSISNDLNIKKINSSNFHVGAVFGLEVYPFNDSPYLSSNTFFTCGADDTIRVWNIQRNDIIPSKASIGNNICSKDLKKTIYFCETYDILNEQPRKNFTTVASDVLETQTGIRCLKISPDGKELAGGFRNGNIVVLDLTKNNFDKIFECEAHDDEVRCMEYSKHNDSSLPYLFATASRDRNIHIFDPNNKYSHLYVIKECSSTVTSLLFANYNNNLFLYTSAADKLVIMSKILKNDNNDEIIVERERQISCNSGINNVVLSPSGNIIAACHDKTIRVLSKTGKEINIIKGTISNQGQVIKISLDPSGSYSAITCSDRYTYIIEMSSGNCVAVLGGQSDSIASVSFSPDCKRIILVSYSGCIYVWRLSNQLTKKMYLKLGKITNEGRNSIDIDDEVIVNKHFDGNSDRSISPDSVIESASDSASVVGTKKNQIQGGSNFGSITSVQITGDEDDLDSGVGIQQNSNIIIQDNLNNRDKSFLHRISTQETLRPVEINFTEEKNNKSQPSSINFSSGNENILKTLPQRNQNTSIDINGEMLNAATQNHLQHHSYIASRSMSNIHHGEQHSDIRGSGGPRPPRRRWGALNSSQNSSFQQNSLTTTPQTPPNNNNFYPSSSTYQQPQKPSSSSMPNSKSLGSIRSQMIDEMNNSQLLNSTTPRTSTMNLRSQILENNRLKKKDENSGVECITPSSYSQFRRETNGVRNSISKRFNNSDSNSVSSPGSERKTSLSCFSSAGRRQSSLFHGSTQNLRGSGNDKRQISINISAIEDMMSKSLIIPRANTNNFLQNLSSAKRFSNNNTRNPTALSTLSNSSNNNNNKSGINVRRKIQMLEGQNNNKAPPGNYSQSPLHLRSRSQSPSTLAVNLEMATGEQNRRRDSNVTLGGKSMYSSKSNLRTLSSATLGQSSSALNKLSEIRNKLRKSQENLALAMALEDQERKEEGNINDDNSTVNCNMLRSRSIGNLKLSTVTNSINIGGKYQQQQQQSPDLKTQRSRSLAKSATNLQDEEYNNVDKATNNRPISSSRFSSSIKNLQRTSRPDLTDASLYTNDNSSQFEKESNDENNINGSYFSISSNKLRKGAVQKRVERNQPKNRLYSRLDQGLTSGDSDSNASDVASFSLNQSPYTMGYNINTTYSSKNGSSTTSSTPQTPTEGDNNTYSNLGPRTTISSIEGMPKSFTSNQFRRFTPNTSGTGRKGSNYFAQKLGEEGCSGVSVIPPTTNNNITLDNIATTPAAQNMTKHVTECISEFQTCLDKLLSARHILANDTSLPKECSEYLLQAIEKVSGNARNRL
ncbi:WD40 repeat and WD40/YVTN repeat-like-containing domain and WD40-repeat-containing domain-containing protein [Strongyloides ratti]|uniref:WD40 repeat and WD40/YVTN repeat-like-containing domain and WD40-repeat-containing domain-containing protein n=1 Tax=Strongyloides ratti TaxID=34506 RepID=A0A090MUC6_STRRB|nr:WD40 repeat and WD40/YVTN repeat-like-containing domain and WD40-repeat-containing domain-containing protein [Strongyloides ratti]CEF62148.1 WD40 repeat and WD40/YVTN repeat-like-containing domain and WD40-repeat-containing domain-containing protein [Strongyloides ratti]